MTQYNKASNYINNPHPTKTTTTSPPPIKRLASWLSEAPHSEDVKNSQAAGAFKNSNNLYRDKGHLKKLLSNCVSRTDNQLPPTHRINKTSSNISISSTERRYLGRNEKPNLSIAIDHHKYNEEGFEEEEEEGVDDSMRLPDKSFELLSFARVDSNYSKPTTPTSVIQRPKKVATKTPPKSRITTPSTRKGNRAPDILLPKNSNKSPKVANITRRSLRSPSPQPTTATTTTEVNGNVKKPEFVCMDLLFVKKKYEIALNIICVQIFYTNNQNINHVLMCMLLNLQPILQLLDNIRRYVIQSVSDCILLDQVQQIIIACELWRSKLGGSIEESNKDLSSRIDSIKSNPKDYDFLNNCDNVQRKKYRKDYAGGGGGARTDEGGKKIDDDDDDDDDNNVATSLFTFVSRTRFIDCKMLNIIRREASVLEIPISSEDSNNKDVTDMIIKSQLENFFIPSSKLDDDNQEQFSKILQNKPISIDKKIKSQAQFFVTPNKQNLPERQQLIKEIDLTNYDHLSDKTQLLSAIRPVLKQIYTHQHKLKFVLDFKSFIQKQLLFSCIILAQTIEDIYSAHIELNYLSIFEILRAGNAQKWGSIKLCYDVTLRKYKILI